MMAFLVVSMTISLPAFAKKKKRVEKSAIAKKLSRKQIKAVKFFGKAKKLKGLKVVSSSTKKKKKPFDAFERIAGKKGLESLVNAYLFGVAANTAYKPDGKTSYQDGAKINRKRWNELGLKLCGPNAEYTVSGGSTWDNNVYVLYNDSLVVAVFRGTQGQADLWSDAQVWKKVYELVSIKKGKRENRIAKIHWGFYDGSMAALTTAQVAEQLYDCATRGLKKGKRRSVVFAGHSLGGALAMASAFILTDQNEGRFLVDAIYTYGAPRVGGRTWKKRYHALIPKERTRRWYRGQDPVASVPKFTNWHRVGTPRYLKEYRIKKGGGKNRIEIVKRDGTLAERMSQIPLVDIVKDKDDHNIDTLAKLIFDEMPQKERRKLIAKDGKRLKDGYGLIKGIYKIKAACKVNSDCPKSKYCGGYSKHCKNRKSRGVPCLSDYSCKSNRCSGIAGKGLCAKPDQCKKNSDCESNEFCASLGQNKCKAKKKLGRPCGGDSQCKSNRCSGIAGKGLCAKPDDCKKDKDCKKGYYCGKIGKNQCKRKKRNGGTCLTKNQCRSNRCHWGFCKAK